MLKCKDVVNDTSDYLNNDLSLTRRIGLMIHLAICVNCRRYVKQFGQAVNSVATVKPQEQVDTDTDQLARDLLDVQKRMKSDQD